MTKLHQNEQNVISEFTHRRLAKENRQRSLSQELRGLREVIQNGRSSIAMAATRAEDMGLQFKTRQPGVEGAHIGAYLSDSVAAIDSALRCLEDDLTAIYAAQIEGEK